MAINLYTNKFTDSKLRIVKINDGYFDKWAAERELTEEEKRVIMEIDHAKITNAKILEIVTPFGSTNIKNLSTGCKTILNIISGDPDLVFSLNGCSHEIMDYIFDYIENHRLNRKLYISIDEIGECKNREFYIDNKKLVHRAADILLYMIEGR